MMNTVKIVSKSGRKGECPLRALPLWEAAGWAKADAKRRPKTTPAAKVEKREELPAVATTE